MSKFISIQAACEMLGVDGQAISYGAVYSWMTAGKRSSDGRKIILRSVQMGRRVTTAEWVHDFIENLANAQSSNLRPNLNRSGKPGRPRKLDIDKRLRDLGVA